MLQAGRGLKPDESIAFFSIYLILPAALGPEQICLHSLQLSPKMPVQYIYYATIASLHVTCH
jgi:hypothetical protein